MLHFCTVNRRIMEAARKDRAYVTVLIDLVNAGVVTKAKAEALLGYTLPDHVLDNTSAPVDTPTSNSSDSSSSDNDDSGNDDSGNDDFGTTGD